MTRSYYKYAIAAALLLAPAAAGLYWFWHRPAGTFASSFSFVPVAAGSAFTSTVSTTGYLSYTNQQYHFALLYPPNVRLKEYQEGGGAFTAAFQDLSTNEGFEVYVTPYSDSQVTLARFNEDEPSGVLEDPTTIVVDGTPAVMFYGSNAVMGDTREVWFIKGGYLYEVTTYKELDQWLSQIMATWKFI